MNQRVFVAAAIAGVFVGVLSSLPVVSLFNCVLCAWMWLGGVFAVYLVRRAGAPPLSRQEGVLVGLLTGTVAGVVSIAFTLAGVGGAADTAQQIQRQLEPAQIEQLSSLWKVMQSSSLTATIGCVSLMLHLGLGALGGALGAAWITRRRM